MKDLNKKQIDLLKALAELFYEKIMPDKRFLNERISEWCENLPLPPTSSVDSNDADAIEEIAKIHQRLEYLDDVNIVKGDCWCSHIIDEFSEELNLLHKKIKGSDVDPSISNLYHVHNSVLLKAQGEYDDALEELNKSSILLKQKIETHEHYLPRYTREIFMNLGASSELNRLNGNIDKAISIADEMYKLSMKESKNKDYANEDSKALCLSTSWALYYCCEAHLAVPDWDDPLCQRDREWYFSETFSKQIYQNWIVPVQIKIIKNPIWEQRYPEYFGKIADLVYIDTAKGTIKKAMRETSVFFGRIRLKRTMPITLVTLIAALAIQSANTSPQSKVDPQESISVSIDILEKDGISIDAKSRETLETAIQEEIKEIISSDKLRKNNISRVTPDISDRGVGVGLSAEAHLLLPLTAFASDRGVGVG